VSARQRLRSATHGDLTVPATRTNYGQRSFSAAGPLCWNSLYPDVRDPSVSVHQFCRHLKTELFCQGYYAGALPS